MSYLRVVLFVSIFGALGAFAEPIPKILLTPGVFRMFPVDSPDRPNPHCSVYRELILDEAEMTGSFAVTNNRVAGFCELYVFPDETYYNLKYSASSCGSLIYEGNRVVENGVERITVTDHRNRRCHDLQPGLIELSVERPGGETLKFVSRQ